MLDAANPEKGTVRAQETLKSSVQARLHTYAWTKQDRRKQFSIGPVLP